MLGGDAPRVMTFELDEHGRPEKAVDAEGSETTYTYDTFGNKTSMVDANGNQFSYVYTARNMMAETRLHDWRRRRRRRRLPVLQSYAYDMGGRVARHTDTMGRDPELRVLRRRPLKSITLKDFRNPDGSKRDILVEANTYDGAGTSSARRPTTASSSPSTPTTPWAARSRAVTDPNGLARRTSFTYDLAGNVADLRLQRRGLQCAVADQRHARDRPLCLRRRGQRQDGDHRRTARTPRTTTYDYDQRGRSRPKTDPARQQDGVRLRRAGPASCPAPCAAVQTESNGSAPVTSRPTT